MAGKGKVHGRHGQTVTHPLPVASNKIFFSADPYRLIVESDAGTPLVDDFSASGSPVCRVQTKQNDEVT
jgi:hypothetical protein